MATAAKAAEAERQTLRLQMQEERAAASRESQELRLELARRSQDVAVMAARTELQLQLEGARQDAKLVSFEARERELLQEATALRSSLRAIEMQMASDAGAAARVSAALQLEVDEARAAVRSAEVAAMQESAIASEVSEQVATVSAENQKLRGLLRDEQAAASVARLSGASLPEALTEYRDSPRSPTDAMRSLGKAAKLWQQEHSRALAAIVRAGGSPGLISSASTTGRRCGGA